METQGHTRTLLAGLLAATLAIGCSSEPGDGTTAASDRPATQAATGNEATTVELTDANLEAYARALAKQAEIIRRPGRGTHYGVIMSAYDMDGESGEVLKAAGMTAQEFHAVDDLVDPVFTTLNFQGEIGPPRSIDLEAAPEWKERLEGDPFADLAPESAAALRRHMDTLVPLWSDIVGLTAQHGR